MYIAGVFLAVQTISFPAMRVLMEGLVSFEDYGLSVNNELHA